MKRKYFTNLFSSVCAVFFLAFSCSLSAKEKQAIHTEDYARHAVGVLIGTFYDYSKEEAATILHEIAEQDSMPYAMNALGLAYLKGTGVQRNPQEAMHWLEEAGKCGIAEAYHNIGAAYKRGIYGVRQDLTKAYEAFYKGALLGSKVCSYDAGFMLYKGLGCQQSYTKAIELFEAAAQKGHGGAMYMLGLCHRNGYGTEQNEEKGIELLNKAADYGYRDAMEELARPYPENCLYNTQTYGNDSILLPLSMPQTDISINDISLFNGDYDGWLIVYDWSGKFILKEIPVKMSVHRNNNEVSGILFLEDYDIPFYADILDDGTLKFNDSYANLKERYTKKGKVKYKLNYAKLDIWKDEVKGELSLYSLKEREPEKPMYLQLHRSDSPNRTLSGYNSISVSPNPFTSEIKAAIELANASDVNVRIFDKYGIPVFQQNMGLMGKGKQDITLTPDLKNGFYILNITAGKKILRTIIIKGRSRR